MQTSEAATICGRRRASTSVERLGGSERVRRGLGRRRAHREGAGEPKEVERAGDDGEHGQRFRERNLTATRN
jgi:hypothetical protein